MGLFLCDDVELFSSLAFKLVWVIVLVQVLLLLFWLADCSVIFQVIVSQRPVLWQWAQLRFCYCVGSKSGLPLKQPKGTFRVLFLTASVNFPTLHLLFLFLSAPHLSWCMLHFTVFLQLAMQIFFWSLKARNAHKPHLDYFLGPPHDQCR